MSGAPAADFGELEWLYVNVDDGDAFQRDETGWHFRYKYGTGPAVPGIDSLQNLGGGAGVFDDILGSTARLRTLISSDDSIDVAQDGNVIDFRGVPSGVQTVSNIGGGPGQIAAGLVGTHLDLRTLTSGDGSLTFDTGASLVDIRLAAPSPRIPDAAFGRSGVASDAAFASTSFVAIPIPLWVSAVSRGGWNFSAPTGYGNGGIRHTAGGAAGTIYSISLDISLGCGNPRADLSRIIDVAVFDIASGVGGIAVPGSAFQCAFPAQTPAATLTLSKTFLYTSTTATPLWYLAWRYTNAGTEGAASLQSKQASLAITMVS